MSVVVVVVCCCLLLLTVVDYEDEHANDIVAVAAAVVAVGDVVVESEDTRTITRLKLKATPEKTCHIILSVAPSSGFNQKRRNYI